MHIFDNFKSFSNTELNLFSNVTYLIGPNGSGKSNAIEGIELLSALAQGRPFHEITDVGRGGKLEIRGGLQSCAKYGKNSFGFGFRTKVEKAGIEEHIDYKIKIRVKPTPRISQESLYSNKVMIFNTVKGSHSSTSGDVTVEYNNSARGGNKPRTSTAADRSILSQYTQFVQRDKKYSKWTGLIYNIQQYFQSSFVFDPDPKLMRSYERIGNSQLQRNGANLSSVLFNLSLPTISQKKKRKSIDNILERIRQLPEKPYEKFEFVKTELDDVIFGFKEPEAEGLVDARLLSDGTLRSLAVLTSLETAAVGSRVVIEEFDNGLHPSRVKILTEAITDCAKRRRLNVLVTTHNPATLNCLEDEQLDCVVLCVWRGLTQGYELIRLSDLPRFDELIEQGRLGDLVTMKILDNYLDPHFDSVHKARMKKWLEDL